MIDMLEVEMLVEVAGTPSGGADRLKFSIGRCLTKQPVGTLWELVSCHVIKLVSLFSQFSFVCGLVTYSLHLVYIYISFNVHYT